MPKMKFSKRFNVRKDERTRLEYKPGKTYEVSQEVADRALKSKAGEIQGAKKAG